MQRVFAPLRLCAAAAALWLSGAGCGPGPEVREYDLTGQVLAVRPERYEIVIRHDDIAGFMPGMTMPFRVRDVRWLAGVSPGEVVHARLVLDQSGAYLSRIQRTGRTEALPEGFDAPMVMDAPVEPGDPVPDLDLVDHLGRAFAIRDLRGAPFAVTFTYTRCPLPTYCPAQDQRFGELQREIRARPDLARSRLVSISIDPEYDRPEVLARHADTLGADPSIWRLATGERAAILAFAASLALSVAVEEDGSDLVHSLRTAVVDGEGRLIRRYDGTGWQVSDVVRDLARAQ